MSCILAFPLIVQYVCIVVVYIVFVSGYELGTLKTDTSFGYFESNRGNVKLEVPDLHLLYIGDLQSGAQTRNFPGGGAGAQIWPLK